MIPATTRLVKLATLGLEPQRLTANKQETLPSAGQPQPHVLPQMPTKPSPPPLARTSQMPLPTAVAANQAKVLSPKTDGYYGAAPQQSKWWQNPWLWGGVGAGALGAYGLSRLGRRRRDDDDEKEASYKQATTPLTPAQVIANKQNTSAALANLIALSFASGGMLGVGAHGLGMVTRGRLPAKARMPSAPIRLTPRTDKKKKEQPKQASDAACATKQECAILSPQAVKALSKWPKRPRRRQPPKPPVEEEQKTAANEWDPEGRGWVANTLGKPIYDTFMKSKPGAQPSYWGGDNAKDIVSHPMFAGLGIPAGMLAFYAGNRATDAVGDRLKKQEKDRELAQVKKRFDELLKMSSAGTFDKYADDESLLGRIASGATKQLASTVAAPFLWAGRQAVEGGGEAAAEGWDRFTKDPRVGTAGGLGLAWALTSGGLTGKAMYDFTRGSQEKRMLEEALRKRRDQVSKRHLPAVRISEPEEEELQ